jgi:hypothetical protein
MMVPQEIWARILVDDNSKLGVCFFLHWNRHGLSGRGSTHMQRLVCKGVCVGGGAFESLFPMVRNCVSACTCEVRVLVYPLTPSL